MVCLHVKYKLSLHSKSSYPPSTVLQLPGMCSVAHALGWLICTIRIFAFRGALTRLYSAHSNFRLAGWLKTKSLVRTGIIPLALHIVERQNLPFSVQMLKGNVLHCTMPNSCPTPRNTQPCCRPPTSDGRSNADQFMKLVLGALQFKGHTMSAPFKIFNIALASLMAVTSIASSIAAVRYIVVSSCCLHACSHPLVTHPSWYVNVHDPHWLCLAAPTRQLSTCMSTCDLATSSLEAGTQLDCMSFVLRLL